MIVDPQKIIQSGCIEMSQHSKVQQSGIDVSINRIRMIEGSLNDTILYKDIELPSILTPGSYDIECHEIVQVPANAIMLFVVRSTWNRRGAFITTGVFDNGFNGKVGGVLHVTVPLELNKNERIGQIVFMRSEGGEAYNGQYQSASWKIISV